MANDYSSIKANIWTSQGTIGQLITLRGIGGTYAIQAGAVAISYTDVQDCVGTGAAIPFNDPNGVDSGNNLNWNFGQRNILYSPGAYNPLAHGNDANAAKPEGAILHQTPNSGSIKTDKPGLL